MLPNIRQAAVALFAGGCLACFIDLVLAILLNTVRVSGDVPLVSLIPARIAARGLWLTGPPLLWTTARPIAAWLEPALGERFRPAPLPPAVTWKLVALLMMVVPPLLLLAGWAASAFRVTLAGSWAFEGPLFLSLAFYTNSTLAIAPTVLAGTALHRLGNHFDTRS